MRILLVEDEPYLGTALKDMLNQHNYVVDWVLDGGEAWNYLETKWTNYHVAIFDERPRVDERRKGTRSS